ncbi:hypothetical protein B0H19DRAFT_1253686 [Mycena capillaripes]|nr:hypothetical protein B0H19DRAFT_1253686 [Mycena capillaripes]
MLRSFPHHLPVIFPLSRSPLPPLPQPVRARLKPSTRTTSRPLATFRPPFSEQADPCAHPINATKATTSDSLRESFRLRENRSSSRRKISSCTSNRQQDRSSPLRQAVQAIQCVRTPVAAALNPYAVRFAPSLFYLPVYKCPAAGLPNAMTPSIFASSHTPLPSPTGPWRDYALPFKSNLCYRPHIPILSTVLHDPLNYPTRSTAVLNDISARSEPHRRGPNSIARRLAGSSSWCDVRLLRGPYAWTFGAHNCNPRSVPIHQSHVAIVVLEPLAGVMCLGFNCPYPAGISNVLRCMLRGVPSSGPHSSPGTYRRFLGSMTDNFAESTLLSSTQRPRRDARHRDLHIA